MFDWRISFKPIMAPVLALAAASPSLASSSALDEYHDCEKLNSSVQKKPNAKHDWFDQLSFEGFCIKDHEDAAITAKAKAGLSFIYLGYPFRGTAFPLALKPSLDAISAQAPPSPGPQPDIDANTLEGGYKVFGNMPSPRSRPPVPLPTGDLAVAEIGSAIAVYDNTSAYSGNTCLTCHSSIVGGRLISGVMNTAKDQYAERLKLLGLLQAAEPLLKANQDMIDAGVPSAPTDRMLLTSYFGRIGDNFNLVFANSTTKGDNLGPFVVWRDISRYDSNGMVGLPLGQRSELDDLWQDIKLPTVDANPWWHLKYKDNVYRYSDTSPDLAAHFAFTFNQPHPGSNELRPSAYAIMENILTYIKQLPSPRYKEGINWGKARLGSKLFHGEKTLANGSTLPCSSCHGSYRGNKHGYNVDYNQAIGNIDVGTDPAYFNFLDTVGRTINEVRSPQLADFFGDDATYVPQAPTGSGYTPPPLDGVWASAPYFHNGSVPTVYAVLNSRARPKQWLRTANPNSYNYKKLGLVFGRLSPEQQAHIDDKASQSHPFSHAAVKSRRIYDTTEFGKGNSGHTFGDGMNDRERYAVIEFLKTLGGQ